MVCVETEVEMLIDVAVWTGVAGGSERAKRKPGVDGNPRKAKAPDPLDAGRKTL